MTRYATLLQRYEGAGAPLTDAEGEEFCRLHREHEEGIADHLTPPRPAFRVTTGPTAWRNPTMFYGR